MYIHYLQCGLVACVVGVSTRFSLMRDEFRPTHPRQFTAATCILLLPSRQFGIVRNFVVDDEIFIMFCDGI